MKKLIPFLLLAAAPAFAAEFHVAASGGDDTADGTSGHPLKMISAAAQKAMPGDTITGHAGVYREWVKPPRGGTDDAHRITYRAAPGEKVVITGSEIAKGWERVANDTWKVTVPNKFFGPFNPFAERVRGDWCRPKFAVHRGGVYLGSEWLCEAPDRDVVLAPVNGTPRWFAHVDGSATARPEYLFNIASFTIGKNSIRADANAAKSGTQPAGCSEGGRCVAFIRSGHWLRFDGVDFGDGTEQVAFRVAAPNGTGGDIEIRLDSAEGDLLGTCEITPTGDWQRWRTVSAAIRKTWGKRSVCLVFKWHAPKSATDDTTIYAQFPGVDPNAAPAEIAVRPTVFTPEKTNIDYITVRGFTLENAATQWALPTAAQIGVISAYWNKGWIIEDNDIRHSTCCGVALGKYGDEWDNSPVRPQGYWGTISDAFHKAGWNKEKIGGHIVRRNHIHQCEQAGIVGSLGCAFSVIEGNDIHDIYLRGLCAGEEMGGIKFHGAIDVVIKDNHIYRCGSFSGIWLDWMAQGVRITGNLFHDNISGDIFTEVNHGPFLVANNLLLSGHTFSANSEGAAFAHNFVRGGLHIVGDGRHTPYMKPHATDQLGLHNCPVGDARWHNNILAAGANLAGYNASGKDWPCFMSGNVFAKGANASRFDTDAVNAPGFDTGAKLVKKDDGWYLTLATDAAWKTGAKRKLVDTAMLGKAKIPQQGYTMPDGSPMAVDTDYFGKKRDASNPFPGPFETPVNGEVKVWPK